MIYYKTYMDLSTDIKGVIAEIPIDIDLIVGIPRSGMIPAYMIGAFLNLPVVTVDEYVNNIIPTQGDRKLKKELLSIKKVLIVDDSVNLGNSLKRIKEKLKARDAEYIFFAVYATEKGKRLVDIFAKVCERPRIFQWNYLYHDILSNACLDIDGVLCVDPTEIQNDDGEKYMEFLVTAASLFVPNYKIHSLVTSRLEKYRPRTEKWLKDHNIEYERLFMLNLPSKEERIRQNSHARFKAEIYDSLVECTLFIESDRNQAAEIAAITGKQVLCAVTDEIFPTQCDTFNGENTESLTLKAELSVRNDEIRRMKSSRFWKLRGVYVNIKKIFGLGK